MQGGADANALTNLFVININNIVINDINKIINVISITDRLVINIEKISTINLILNIKIIISIATKCQHHCIGYALVCLDLQVVG